LSAHGVGILTGNERLFRFLLSLGLKYIGGRIAEVVESRIARMAVVEWQTGAVEGDDRIVHRLDIRAYATLVAKTPKNDARMVIVALHQ